MSTSSDIEHFVVVIQIRIVERKEDYLVLVYPKKGEGRKKYFFFQNLK